MQAQKIFFGRRKGKALRDHPADLMQSFLPHFTLDLQQPLAPFKPTTIMEIGFGGGEHLAHHAKLKPEVGFIGVEAFYNGVAKLVADIDRYKINNIMLHHGTVQEVLAVLPDGCLDQIDLFYPDPWPKLKHHKRRIISDEMLIDLARVLKPNAVLRFATDIPHYAQWTLERILRSEVFTWKAQSQSDWLTPYEGWISTRYEQKAIREGRTGAYYTFEKL